MLDTPHPMPSWPPPLRRAIRELDGQASRLGIRGYVIAVADDTYKRLLVTAYGEPAVMPALDTIRQAVAERIALIERGVKRRRPRHLGHAALALHDRPWHGEGSRYPAEARQLLDYVADMAARTNFGGFVFGHVEADQDSLVVCSAGQADLRPLLMDLTRVLLEAADGTVINAPPAADATPQAQLALAVDQLGPSVDRHRLQGMLLAVIEPYSRTVCFLNDPAATCGVELQLLSQRLSEQIEPLLPDLAARLDRTTGPMPLGEPVATISHDASIIPLVDEIIGVVHQRRCSGYAALLVLPCGCPACSFGAVDGLEVFAAEIARRLLNGWNAIGHTVGHA